MAHFWLQVLPVNYPPDQGDPRLALEEALMMHHVEKSPMDFEARYNLGAVARREVICNSRKSNMQRR